MLKHTAGPEFTGESPVVPQAAVGHCIKLPLPPQVEVDELQFDSPQPPMQVGAGWFV